MFRLTSIILCLCLGFALIGPSCASQGDPTQRDVERGLTASDRYLARRGPTRTESDPGASDAPVALLNGEAIAQADLVRPLNEAAGGLILEEILLDRLLERELERAGIEIGAAETDAEEKRLLAALSDNQLARADVEAQEILGRLRSQRGLGAVRYRTLLRRNAALRALVRDQVTISPADLEQAYQLRFGPRYRARLITLPTADEASRAQRRLREGTSFAELASELSTDPSRDRGGLLPPISLADTSFPSALLAALRGMQPGETSSIIALGSSYAIVRLESVDPPPDDAPASASEAGDVLERDARLYQERVLMDELARRLLDDASITVLDPSLDRAWRQRTGTDRSP